GPAGGVGPGGAVRGRAAPPMTVPCVSRGDAPWMTVLSASTRGGGVTTTVSSGRRADGSDGVSTPGAALSRGAEFSGFCLGLSSMGINSFYRTTEESGPGERYVTRAGKKGYCG